VWRGDELPEMAALSTTFGLALLKRVKNFAFERDATRVRSDDQVRTGHEAFLAYRVGGVPLILPHRI
jgi:hypothetical protein